jgi:hypothetical protein
MKVTKNPCASILLMILSCCAVSAQTVINGGFESPSQTPGAFTYGPTVDGSNPWVFEQASGISSSTGAFAPSGSVASQFAFLQQHASLAPNFSQDISFGSTGNYTISYLEAIRSESVSTNYTVSLVNTSTSHVSLLQIQTVPTSQEFTLTSFGFTVPTAGTYKLKFQGNTGADHTTVFDEISISAAAVPEPSSFALLFGLATLGAVATRRRRIR